ncbi:hypothetical protein ACEPPN_007505 [Leptodophora sp. 'Broadleaf-Isolate-01']
MPSCPSHKASIRSKVWSQLRQVAIPDSRFHHDYSSFIADFQGSTIATNHITSLPCYKNAKTIFIAPDNCIQELRYRTLKDGKTVLVTTYGIRRGFWILDPKAIPSERWEMASLLDGMERIGRHVTLRDIESMKIDLMVTGTGAINLEGLRFGKGHGYFDLEWALLYSIGAAGKNTQTVAVVHECQVLDEDLQGEAWDTGCDFVVTNERVIVVKDARKPDCGILWDQLQDGMLEDIEPLRELKERR